VNISGYANDRQSIEPPPLEEIAPTVGTIRITVHSSIPVSAVIEALVDSTPFQRLRGVKQLGPTCFVFPGAHHTRFEHSLGVYSLCTRYLQRLYPLLGKFSQSREDIIRAALVSSLLHDVGHYPFSHLVEEIDALPGFKLERHEQRARKILESDEIKNLLKVWKLSPGLIADLIGKGSLDGGFAVAQSIIDSDLDCDKLDYLLRDSLHCGVTYGHGIDVERFLSALHIDHDNETICLNSRGRTHLLALLGARNIMYQDVYWHKTVRACGAMFKALLYNVIEKGKHGQKEVYGWLSLTDESFIACLMERARKLGDPAIVDLGDVFEYGPRRIYKQVYAFNASDRSTHSLPARRFFRPLFKTEALPPTKLCLERAELLGKFLARHVKRRQPFRLLIEATPVKRGHDLFDVSSSQMWNLRTNTFEALPFDVDSIDNFLRKYRVAYIFAHPLEEEELKELEPSVWTRAFKSMA
jgi:HD superfamily phosphohydrolase